MKAPKVVRQNENARVVVRTPVELFEESRDDKGKYTGGKWGGFYLRAPDIFFRILEKTGDKLVRLGDVAEVRFGIKTGANDFFCLEVLPYHPVCTLCGKVHEEALTKEEEAAYWSKGERPPVEKLVAVRNGVGWEGYIESKFVVPIFKSSREAKKYAVDPQSLDRVFLAKPGSQPSSLLPHSTHYVRWGEWVEVIPRRGRGKGKIKGFHQIASVRGRSPWWSLEYLSSRVVLPAFERARKHVFWNPSLFPVDHALFLALPREVDEKVLFLVLNSSLVGLMRELYGRPPEGGGGGPLQMGVYLYEKMPIPNPKLFGWNDDIRKLFKNFAQTEVPSLLSKAPLTKIQKELDSWVLNRLGLSDLQQVIFSEMVHLVRTRIEQAKSL